MSPTRQTDEKRYQALRRSLAEIGYFRRGSLVQRFLPCGKPGCRCQAHPPRLHGPYWQWTRKVRGKTVTVRLTLNEAQLLGEWIANGRRLRTTLLLLERLSLRLTERLLRQSRHS